MPETTVRSSPCYCINFRRAANTLTKFYDRVFASIGLTTNQFSLLSSIQALGACNKSELAKYARLDRTTIIRSLAVLREKGLIEDTTEAGTRNKGIRLTEAGESAIAEGMAGWKRAQKQVQSLLGADNLSVLKEVFADIESLDEIKDWESAGDEIGG